MAHADKVRNIGIIAHIDAGKTTLTERVLFYAGISHRMGEVHDGDSQMDYLPQERERGITITAAVTQFSWLGAEVHLIDTPGHVDFTIEVERSLRVLDGAVVVFCGVGGVEPQSEVVWRQADRHRIPRLAFINKLDRPGADYDRVIAEMDKKLSARGVPVTAPLYTDGEFHAVADLVTMEKLAFSETDQGTGVSRSALSPEEAAKVEAHREALVEAAADADDGVAESYLSGEEIPPEALRRAIRKGTVAARFFPVFAGAALRNRGIQPVMDGIVHFLPSPAEVPPATGDDPRTGVPVSRAPLLDAPFAALVFKVMIEEGRRTVYLRVYSGKLSEGDVLGNASTGGTEKVARLFRIHAGKKVRIREAVAGDIVAIRGIRNARTGDTLCDPAAPILLESIEIRKPVVSVVVEPRTLRDMDRLREMLAKMVEEDPTLSMKEDADTGQIILSGMGELHLEILVDRLGRDFGLAVRTGMPQVVFRETISEPGTAESVFEREIAERLVTVKIAMEVRPGRRGSGVKVSDRLRMLGLRPGDRGRSGDRHPGRGVHRCPRVPRGRRGGGGDARGVSHRDGHAACGEGGCGDGVPLRVREGEPVPPGAGDGGGDRGARGVPGRRDRGRQRPPGKGRLGRPSGGHKPLLRPGPAEGDVRIRHVPSFPVPGAGDPHDEVLPLRPGDAERPVRFLLCPRAERRQAFAGNSCSAACRGGRSEVKRRRADASHAEPRTEPPSEAAERIPG